MYFIKGFTRRASRASLLPQWLRPPSPPSGGGCPNRNK